MTAPRTELPTLTEVINLDASGKKRGAEPAAATLPLQTESVAMEPLRLDGIGTLDFESTRSDPYLSPPAAPPPSPQALAYDEELVAQVMVRLQPRLEAWVEAQVRRALMEMLPVWAESASLAIVRDLRSEMPELLSIALDEVHRQRHG
jgi:hypothetical protein